MRPTATAAGLVRNAATEEQLWSYLVQLTSVLRAVHCNGGAVRAACLTPSKVWVVRDVCWMCVGCGCVLLDVDVCCWMWMCVVCGCLLYVLCIMCCVLLSSSSLSIPSPFLSPFHASHTTTHPPIHIPPLIHTPITTPLHPPHPHQVLVTSAGRIRVGSLGIPETLSPDPIDTPQDIQQLQRADLTALGNLLLALACSGVASTPSVEVLASHFSQELARVAAGLVAGVQR